MVKHIWLLSSLSIVFMLFTACDPYQKVLKSTDYDFKEEKAKEYYNIGQYSRALPLLEELMRIRKGSKSMEKLYYFYSYSHFGQKDYLLAAHYFNTFAQTYPKSIFAEDAKFMSAYSYYQMSPKPSLEQTYTIKAVDAFQIFMNEYPNSDRIERCNELIDEARAKLERKAFISAELYYNIKNYKAAAVSFKNLLKDFPDTRNGAQVQFLVLKSYYLLAENSIESKKKERYKDAVSAYLSLIDKYPDAANIKEAERIYDSCLDELSKLEKLSKIAS